MQSPECRYLAPKIRFFYSVKLFAVKSNCSPCARARTWIAGKKEANINVEANEAFVELWEAVESNATPKASKR
jgi:hypothetical protein